MRNISDKNIEGDKTLRIKTGRIMKRKKKGQQRKEMEDRNRAK